MTSDNELLHLQLHHGNDFWWGGKILVTRSDLVNEMERILHHEDREHAQAFMQQYEIHAPEYAKKNIGYLVGDLARADAQRAYEWFDVEHPVFGRRTDLTDDDIFAMGAKLMGIK